MMCVMLVPLECGLITICEASPGNEDHSLWSWVCISGLLTTCTSRRLFAKIVPQGGIVVNRQSLSSDAPVEVCIQLSAPCTVIASGRCSTKVGQSTKVLHVSQQLLQRCLSRRWFSQFLPRTCIVVNSSVNGKVQLLLEAFLYVLLISSVSMG